MKIRRHYISLRRAYSHREDGAAFEATTSELAETLDCTHRNMVFLLKRMVQEGWIHWIPRRGRGNRSLLTFNASVDRLLLEEAKELVLRGDLQSALGILQGATISDQFQDWLAGQFGFRTEVEGKQRTDMLRFPLPGIIHSLDPAKIHYFGESHLVNQLFDGLVRMDVKGKNILPHLAHAWETDETRTEWTFYLRKGVLFHHGRTMTAADVKYSLERLRTIAPNGLYSWVYNDICSMDIVDDTTISITLEKRNELFLSFLTTNRASIVPQEVCETEGDRFGSNGSATVGTGPFRLASSDQGIWSLDAFAPYFQGRAFLDRVEVWAMPDHADGAQQQTNELRQFQVMHNVRISAMSEGEWRQVRQSGTTCKFVTINELKDGPMRNAAIRGLINRALDRRKLLELLSGDVIEAASGFLPHDNDVAGTLTNRPEATIEEEGKDIQIALAKAGYRGERLTLVTIPQYSSDAELIKQLLEPYGVPLDIRLIPAEQFKGSARMTADLLLFAVMLDEHSELRLIDLYKSMQQHMPPETGLERSLQMILAEANAAEAASLFRQIERQLTGRHSLLFLYRKHLKTAFHPSVRGISLESLGWVRFRDLWFR